MNYYFHPSAESEHLETVAFYESRKPGLGSSYLTEFEQVMKDVCAFCHINPIEKMPDIRRKRMKKFPFTILYREINGSVQILAIAHHRRRPAYWMDRL